LSEELEQTGDETNALSNLSNTLPVQLGEVIGGYRLDRVLGEGSAGCVYLGTHTLLGRRAAVKVLYPHLSHQPDLVRRFFHEARVVNDIRHANIVDIVDFVQTETPHVIAYVMEYIKGPSLADVLKERRLSRIQTANVSRQLCSALAAAHELGVVHRDLKPENIVLLESPDSDLSVIPSVKILDFGIAKIEHERRSDDDSLSSNPTEAGVMMGTPRYMAPEQIGNDNVSPKTDVYALAELLYEMLTGQPVFVGSNMAVFQAKLSHNPLNLNLPSDALHVGYLTRIIRAGLAREPADRIDLSEFSQAVGTWIQTPGDSDMSQVSVGGLVQGSVTGRTSTIPTATTGGFENINDSQEDLSGVTDNQATLTSLAYRANKPSVFLLVLGIAAAILIAIAYSTKVGPADTKSTIRAPKEQSETQEKRSVEPEGKGSSVKNSNILRDEAPSKPEAPKTIQKPLPQTLPVPVVDRQTKQKGVPEKPALAPARKTKPKRKVKERKKPAIPSPETEDSESPMNREEMPQW